MPTRRLSCGDLELVKSLALEGVGAALLPRRVAAYGQEGRLVRLHPELPVGVLTGVLLALGRPKYKPRETKDGLETEDWVYGTPPGKITFVTFNGDKVIKVKDEYAGLGTDVGAEVIK